MRVDLVVGIGALVTIAPLMVPPLAAQDSAPLRGLPQRSDSLAGAVRAYLGHRSVIASDSITLQICVGSSWEAEELRSSFARAPRPALARRVLITGSCRFEDPWSGDIEVWPAVRIHRMAFAKDSVVIEAASGHSPADRTIEIEFIRRGGALMSGERLTIGPMWVD